MDATMEVLRLVSSEGYAVDRVSGGDVSAKAAANGTSQRQQHRSGPTAWLNGAALPSKEVLLSLMWVLRVEERRLQIRNQLKVTKPGTPSVPKTTAPTMSKTTTYVLRVLPKRGREAEGPVPFGTPGLKRQRFQ